MTEDALSVYRSLTSMDVKVALMVSPHGPVPAQLVPKLSQLRGTAAVQSTWPSNRQPNEPFTLQGELPDRLERIRQHLDQWWSKVGPEVQNYLIENRDGELDADYKAAVMDAGDGNLDGLIVAVVQDNNTEKFRLPPIVDVYVEMKARDI
ncbi:hypothetical protein SAMN04489835_3630 [Mycolicibacterium rutilum]|uniref:Uncharacterized protein n=1 Tax=Mycolicibacterium rutilum TaxID=370526 RepID=A0A1H6KT38_MYCRU|nr:hypothetical protein [Mycolicibacterium rutilum]SEH75038.1 hypothetical protein SAMN04489835_3630 [Mycolicibacterium rutilum]